MRTLVDLYTDSDDISVDHRIMIIDIEVEVTEGFPSVSKASNKITSIALYDSTTDKYFCYVLDEKLTLDKDFGDNVYVNSCLDEYELLNEFYKKYLEIKPTIITGWNTNRFDIPYLYHRSIQILGEEIANCLSPINVVNWNKYRNYYTIAGVSCLDYLELYKKFTFSQKSSYRLDNIGELEVGIRKIGYDGTLNDLYEYNLEKFVEYNINDVRIVKKLDEKLDFIEIARGISHVGHVPYEDIYFSSRYLEGAIFVYLKQLDIVAPNKGKKEDSVKKGKFIGAYVQEPKAGKHDWVYDLDLTSMYPSVIRTLNISPETKIGKVVGWDVKEFLKGKKKTYSIIMDGKMKGTFTETELKNYLDSGKVSISSNGILYKTDKQGLIPALLTKWFNERKEYRKLSKKFAEEGDDVRYGYFDRRQYLQKIILNSLYGVLGLPVFRFYDIDNAEATTTTSQDLIKYTKKMTNYFYNKELQTNKDYCIYIDTDSVFYSALPLIKKRFPNFDGSDVIMSQHILEIANEVQLFLNKSYDYFSKKFLNVDIHNFEIKQELIAKSGLFITKKRYGMKVINDNGVKVNKIIVKGIDIVRSSFPIAMAKLLKAVLEDILSDVPKDKIDDRIIDFKKSMKLMDLDTVSIPTGVKGITKYTVKGNNNSMRTSFKKGAPVHVKSAIAYNDLLKHFGKDKKYDIIRNRDKIRWVYLKTNPFGFDTLAYKGYEDPSEIIEFIKLHINYEKIFNQLLTKKLDAFYKSLGWEEPTDKSQSIEKFF